MEKWQIVLREVTLIARHWFLGCRIGIGSWDARLWCVTTFFPSGRILFPSLQSLGPRAAVGTGVHGSSPPAKT